MVKHVGKADSAGGGDVAPPAGPEVSASQSSSLDPQDSQIWKTCWARGLRVDNHDQKVKLYQHYGTKAWHVVHLLILERCTLPAAVPDSKPDLAFDDNGYGGVVDDSVPAKFSTICLELVFKKTLCETIKEHEQTVFDQSGKRPVVWTLASRLKRFTPLKVTFAVGDMEKDHVHAVFAAAMPRGGCRHFWDAIEIYSALKLKSYKGKASKWVYESMPSWCEQLVKMAFLGHHCLPSRRAEGSAIKLKCRDPLVDVIPDSAVSTLCLVQLLVRWSSMKPHLGGLTDTKAQRQRHRSKKTQSRRGAEIQ